VHSLRRACSLNSDFMIYWNQSSSYAPPRSPMKGTMYTSDVLALPRWVNSKLNKLRAVPVDVALSYCLTSYWLVIVFNPGCRNTLWKISLPRPLATAFNDVGISSTVAFPHNTAFAYNFEHYMPSPSLVRSLLFAWLSYICCRLCR
jgi:hypothetical protein